MHKIPSWIKPPCSNMCIREFVSSFLCATVCVAWFILVAASMLAGGLIVQLFIYLADNNGDFSESAAMSAFGESGFWDFDDQYFLYSFYFTLFWNAVIIVIAIGWCILVRFCHCTAKRLWMCMCSDARDTRNEWFV